MQGKSADLQDQKGVIYPRINVDQLKLTFDPVPRVPHKNLRNQPTPPTAPAPQPPAPTPTPSSVPATPPSAPATPPSAPATPPSAPIPPPSAPAPAPTPSAAPATPLSAPTASAAPAPPPSAPAPTSPAAPAPPSPAFTPRHTKTVAEKYVRDAWAGNVSHVLLSKVGAYKMFYWDISQIGPNMEMESEAINAYMSIIVRDHNAQNTQKAAVIDSFAMTAIWQGKSSRIKIKPLDYHILLGIINQNHHWILAAIYPHEKRSLLMGPLGESKQNIKRCLERTRAFLRNKGCNVSRWTCDTVEHPFQTDGTSCGVFSLKFAEKILQNERIHFSATQQAINRYRMEIAVTLLLQTDDLNDLCFYCGTKEHETDIDWIQCDICLRWFHQTCVGSPSPQETFVCPACVH
ncbi:uncharacterized protein LOC121641551 [Melanotaenia boesemani]|uniref:uncharacterized protein LOC121641551 n=1 Tax=Melanotaenia boesemani TaxID=1250792 RepID=UPI001C049D89|nr:uncharacterized protein LOC121641551 [Melanotaenia boesemani]